MIYPKALKKGDTVGVIAPSSPITIERAEKCKSVLENLGFQVKLAENLTENYGGYMAGSAKKRAECLNCMFSDNEVSAIICARGGDSGNQIMSYIDFDTVKSNPKVFVGYSDVTGIHTAFNQICDLATFHGPMVSSNIIDDFDEETRKSFFETLSFDRKLKFRNPHGHELGIMHNGRASGILTGGNLTLLATSIGTPYELNAEGKILFIEEVNEDVSKIDRMMYQLKNSGKLASVTGVMLGQFERCNNKRMPEYGVIECLRDVFSDINVPIMYDIQSGHSKPMMTLPFGVQCSIDTKRQEIIFNK